MFFSLDFLLLFLPLTFLGFAIIKKISPPLCPFYLVALLYISLYIIDFVSFALVFVTSNANYLFVRKIHGQKNQKLLVTLGIICAILPLITFKFGQNLFEDTSSDSSILFTLGIPIGLSFYALQQITAISDCRNRSLPILPYSRHLLYLGFFPNFIAGPVYPYRNAVQPISTLGYKAIPDDWIGNGLLLFLTGLAKKLWIANPIGGAIDHILSEIQTSDKTMNIFEAWFVVWGFLVQLYFDFSAYSDIAIGLALCFGILLPINFDSPLKSHNTQEYISRWHISFTSFVREYFFIPILSILKRLPIKDTETRMTVSWAISLFASYIVIGIWHAPNLVVMASSSLVIIVLFLIKLPSLLSTEKISTLSTNKTKNFINRFILLLFSMLMAICLKTQDIDTLTKIYTSLLNFDNVSVSVRLQNILPTFLEKSVAFNGFSPLLNNYYAGEYIFISGRSYLIVLMIATTLIFLSPNTMSIFEIKSTAGKKFFRLGKGARFYLSFILLFIATIFALVFESYQIQNFIYERF